MKATAIYIPELGEIFFIEEIASITNISLYGRHTIDTYQFFIKYKNGLTREFNTVRNTKTGFINIQKKEWLESIRNQFLQHCNIINAQETDKEHLDFDKGEINCIWHGLEIVRPELRKKVFDKLGIKMVIQSELHK